MGGIDFISVDGKIRHFCLEYAMKIIKPHGGILLFDNSDREGNDGKNSTKMIPKHWLQFDSYVLQKHIDLVENERWLLNGQTSIWITRDERCMGEEEEN